MMARAALSVIPAARPRHRGECADGPRPCPWAGCRHHLLLTVNEETGTLRLDHDHDDPTRLMESCSLDVADRGGATLQEIATILGQTRENMRMIEVKALRKLKMDGELDDTSDLERLRARDRIRARLRGQR